MPHVTELQPGDQLVCYMRLGLAVFQQVNQHTKEVYRQVPSKGRRARNNDLTRFFAMVKNNNVSASVLSLEIVPFNSRMDSTERTGQPIDIHYSAFARINLLSPIAYTARQPSQQHPTSFSPLGYMNYRPYRTLVAVSLR